MSPPHVLVLTPTIFEYRTVSDVLRGKLASGALAVQSSGVGHKQVNEFCKDLETRPEVHVLVLLGWAGGLSPALKPGDFVVADRALEASSKPIHCRTIPITAASIGPVLTTPAPLLTPQDKQAAYVCGALAVEMEAYPLAAWADAHRLPFIHARVILDGADEPLPNIGPSFDPYGRLQLSPLLRQLGKRPGLIGEAWRLARRIRAIEPRLGELARAITDELL